MIDKAGFELAFLAAVCFAALAGIAASYIDEPAYRWLVREDSVFEWFSFCALAAVSAVCFYRLWALYGERDRLFRAMLAFSGLLFVFGAGEEISWGQRILGIETPGFFERANLQKETNLHNLQIGDVKINKLIFGKVLGVVIGFYLIAVPWIHRRFAPARAWLGRLAVPVPRLAHAAVFLSLFVLINLLDVPRKGELIEFAGCSVFFSIFLRPANQPLFESAAEPPPA